MNLVEVIDFFPTVELPFDGEILDIRDFVIDGITLNSTLEIALHSDGHQLQLKFTDAHILEDHGTSSKKATGTWLLSISRADSFSLDTRRDTLAFSLDFAAIPGWIVSCSTAIAIVGASNPRSDVRVP